MLVVSIVHPRRTARFTRELRMKTCSVHDELYIYTVGTCTVLVGTGVRHLGTCMSQLRTYIRYEYLSIYIARSASVVPSEDSLTCLNTTNHERWNLPLLLSPRRNNPSYSRVRR
jgi:hypothetical protein